MKGKVILSVVVLALVSCMTVFSGSSSTAFAAEGVKVRCEDCNQSGKCDYYRGKGYKDCKYCSGTGTRNDDECSNCEGTGI
jgi:hypothetical protein